MTPTTRVVMSLIFFCLVSPLLAQDNVDLSVIHQIKQEAFKNSKVMDHLFFLADVHGPRLTGSPGLRAAADWALQRLHDYGLENTRLEKWGPFGRGWSCSHFSVQLLEPGYSPLIGIPLAWSPSTRGPVSGELMMAPISRKPITPKQREEELEKFIEKYKGKLKEKMVMISETKQPELTSTTGKRLTDAELGEVAMALEPAQLPPYDPAKLEIPEDPKQRQKFFENAPLWIFEVLSMEYKKSLRKMNQFFREEGVLAVIRSDERGDGGTVFGEMAGSWDPKEPMPPPSIVLTVEHYNRIARLVEKKISVRVEVDLQTKFHDGADNIFNVIAEIPGGKKKDEIVMLGAHLDSWTGGTGATDNAVGCAVIMEAVRILQSVGFKLDRTVRLALWSGEEQGLLGSRAYVKEHFSDPETMNLKPEHGKLAGYFNLDNGSGKIRGVYLQSNDTARPIFEAWLAPFKDMGVSTISIRDTGGTDHQSYDQVGLPGFQFIQDPLEYSTRTHHSNMDVYDHAQPGDLMQASAVLASVIYHAAMRDQMMPRKPLPKAIPKREEKRPEKELGSIR
jgi:hypothetical protein